MRRAALSVFVFGVYLVGLGLALLLVPNLLLQLFGQPPTSEIWVRLNGMFVIFLSFYYIMAARAGMTAFIKWTVVTRMAVIVYFAAFILLLEAPKTLLVFGLVDLAAATWTWVELRKEAE